MSCDKEGGEMNEAESLQANNDSDISVSVHSEHDTGVNGGRLKDNASTEVINNAALSAPEASQCSNQQYNDGETETADIDGNCAHDNDQHTNSTVVNNHKSCEQHLPCSIDVSISKAVNSRSKNPDDSLRSSHTKSASVSDELVKSSSSTARQSPVELLPKPTYTLLPVGVGVPLVVVVNAGTVRANGDRKLLPTIAPRPANIVGSNTSVPAVSQEDSSLVGRRGSIHGDMLLHRMQQKSVASVLTQTSSLPAHPRCKTVVAATQTSESFAPASRQSKVSRASQVVYF